MVIRRRTPQAAATGSVDFHRRVQHLYVDINDIQPYQFNPRDNSQAIPAVAESIKAYGFLVPCVIGPGNVLVTGHTRVEAAKFLGLTEIPCIRADHLTQDQINQFRLIDNKVASIAQWDHDLLAGEINKLADTGIDWTKFGWNQEEIDCLSEVVSADCLDAVETAQQAQSDAAGTQQRRAPQTARFVLGEITFFIQAAAYRRWADGLRNLHEFSEDAIVRDIKRRLGIVE